jgi:predicted cupin superfamily sugar epimerase/SAM-dependent methyltransferase
MRINNYGEKANTYAQHNKDEGTISLAYREFGAIFDRYVTSGDNLALDFGSGVGHSRKYLESIGFNADGVDIDEAMVTKAKELDRKNESKYQLITVAVIPQRPSRYDLAFSSLVVLEMSTKEEIAQYFAEAYRVMKFDGTFVVLTVNDDFYKHQWTSIDTNYPGNMEAKSGDRVRIKIKEINLELDDFYWTKADYREIATAAGFTIIEEVEPRAAKDERGQWVSECDHSPYFIFVMKKTMSLEPTHELSSRLGLNIAGPGRGCFVETFRSPEIIAQADLPLGYSGDRNANARIRLLMTPGEFWPFHQLKSTEVFRHIRGNDLLIHCIDAHGQYRKVFLGEEHDDAVKEFTIPENCWYAEEVFGGGGYSLIEATTSPGFHPDDLIEVRKEELLAMIQEGDEDVIEAIERFYPTATSSPLVGSRRFQFHSAIAGKVVDEKKSVTSDASLRFA